MQNFANGPMLQGGNADSRLTTRAVLTPGKQPKTKSPAAFGDAALQKKTFADQIVVCGKDFSSR